jgi:hypothetical protein
MIFILKDGKPLLTVQCYFGVNTDWRNGVDSNGLLQGAGRQSRDSAEPCGEKFRRCDTDEGKQILFIGMRLI